MNSTPKQLSLKEVVLVYHIPEWTLRAYTSKHLIPFRRIGRKIYFDVEALEKWLKSGDIEPRHADDEEND